MKTEIRVSISDGRVESIEVTEKKSMQRKSVEAELRELLKPILDEGKKQCN